MINSIIDYVKNEEFAITIWKNKINIVNFKEVIILEEDKIVVTSPDSKIVIRGNNLSINKLLDNELLITGKFNTIELGD